MTISLRDALREIDLKDYRDGRGDFSVVFMKCHRDDRTGGDLVFLDKACSCGLPPTCKGHEMRGIKDMETGRPYAVHNRLLFVFNGKEIFWR